MVGLLVVGAIFFAIAFQVAPPPSSSVGAQDMREVTWDALDSINTLYYDDPAYDNRTISKAMADAAAGDTDALVDTLGAFLPTGSLYSVYLNNGFDRVPLYENRTPAGQTVGVSYPIEPNWRFHYANPDLSIHDQSATDQILGLTMVPVFNSNHVLDEGPRLKAEVSGDQRWVPGVGPDDVKFLGNDPQDLWPRVDFSEHVYSSFVENNGSVDPYPSATVHFQCWRDVDSDDTKEPGENEPCYAIDLRNGGGGKMTGYGPEHFGTSAGDARLDFAIHNDGPGSLPTGTTLTIDFPVGMEVESTEDGGFNFTDPPSIKNTYPTPQRIVAELQKSIAPGGTRELQVWVALNDDRYAYTTIDARLSHGAASHSTLLAIVADKAQGTYTGGDTRVAYLSGPRPAGSCAVATDPCPDASKPTSRWGLVLPTPFGPADIRDAILSLPDGEALFDSVAWPSDFHPTYTPNVRQDATLELADGNTITWAPDDPDEAYRAEGYEFVEFQFEVTSNANHSRASPNLGSAQPESSFTGFDPPPHTVQVEPGIWWREIPPKTSSLPGYGMSQTGASVETRGIDARLVHRNALIPGNTTYKLADLASGETGGLRDALHASSLEPDERFVKLGESADLVLDSRDLASFLSSEVGLNSMTMETHIYAPWGLPSLTPVASYTHDAAASALAYGEALLPIHLNTDTAQDVLVASTDGNVYGLSGASGLVMPGFTFALPEGADPANPATPNLLSRASIPSAGLQIAVGTSEGGTNLYLLDGDIDERWKAVKPEQTVKTYAVNTSTDVTGDNWPDVIAAFAAEQVEQASALGNTRLVLYSGQDTGIGVGNTPSDGIGDVVPGWGWDLDENPDLAESEDEGIVLNGTTQVTGMGLVGGKGEPGIWADTGLAVATTGLYTVKSSLDSMQHGDTDQAIEDVNQFSVSIQGAGMVGFRADGTKAFNYTGGRFVEILRADELDVGDDWSGIVAGSPDGYVYGFNGSKPNFPVSGAQIVGATKWSDIEMSNELEGYSAETDGRLYATRDGWTTVKNNMKKLDGQQTFSTRVHPGVLTVDTPDTMLGASDDSKISWWGGRNGMLLRSVDRLETVDTLTPTGQLQAVVSGSTADVEVRPQQLETISFADMDFVDSHAVDENEAWFIANKAVPLVGNVSYVIHTVNAGASWEATEIRCETVGGAQLSGCNLHAMDFDGERLWLVGAYGTVLAQDLTGDATKIDLTGSPGINAVGVLPLELDADETVSIDTVRVGWNDTDELEWMEQVRLDPGSGNQTLWHKTDGGTDVDPLARYNSLYGVNRYADLDTASYVDNAVDNDVVGTGTLYVGPFKKTLDPGPGNYYDGEAFDDKFPLSFTVNVTYEDGSKDHFYIHFNKTGAVTVNELSTASWTTPDNLGFLLPDDCFGPPDPLCTDIHGINVSTPRGSPALVGGAVGERQSDKDVGGVPVQTEQPPLFTLLGNLWTARTDFKLNQTFKDIAVQPGDPSRWIMVGENMRVAATYNGGANWTEVPTPGIQGTMDADVLEAVDFTHPHVPIIGGGEETGLRLFMDGYTEHGQVVTSPLAPETGSVTDSIDHVTFDGSGMIIGDEATGKSQVMVHLWDPDANGAGQGDWVTIYTPTSKWEDDYTFQDATDEIKLKVELSNPHQGYSRTSPQARGQLSIDGYKDYDPDTPGVPDYTFTFDTNDTSVIDSGLDTVDHALASGYRLKPIHNPWVLKLGNEHNGDWSQARSNDTGARITDMELAENGTILWVGTGKIYEWGALPQETPIADPDGTELYAEDNSLYAIDVTTGQTVDWWEPLYFEDPIEFVKVGGDAVYVTTYDPDEAGNKPMVWRLPFDWDGTNHQLHELPGSSKDLRAATVARIEPDVEGNIVLSMLDRETNEGEVGAFEVDTVSGKLLRGWTAMPQVKSLFEFSYEVPRGAVYGAYLAVTTIEWKISQAGGGDLLQTARIHNSFTVTPPNGKVPIAPTYNLEVISWMEDWG